MLPGGHERPVESDAARFRHAGLHQPLLPALPGHHVHHLALVEHFPAVEVEIHWLRAVVAEHGAEQAVARYQVRRGVVESACQQVGTGLVREALHQPQGDTVFAPLPGLESGFLPHLHGDSSPGNFRPRQRKNQHGQRRKTALLHFSTGSPFRRHSGSPPSSRLAASPFSRSSATASKASTQWGPRQ